jgi:hypothetical protein
MMGSARRHESKNSTRVVSRRGSKSRTYPMEKLMKRRPLRGLRPAHPPKSPHGKGMTSMDIGSTQKRRTKRARHRIVMFNMRALTSPRGRGGSTMGKLKRYRNLTIAMNYSYPSFDASGSSQRGWWKEKVNHSNFTQTVVDICKFVTDSCVHVGRPFFNEDSEYAWEEKFEKIKN